MHTKKQNKMKMGFNPCRFVLVGKKKKKKRLGIHFNSLIQYMFKSAAHGSVCVQRGAAI